MIQDTQFWFNLYDIFMVPLGLLVILVVSCLTIMAFTPGKTGWKILIIPVLLTMLIGFALSLDKTLGFAYPSNPIGKVTLLGHARVGDSIDLWVREISKLGKTRLYKVPYSEELERRLQEVQGDGTSRQDSPDAIEWTRNSGDYRKGDIRTYKFSQFETFNKEH